MDTNQQVIFVLILLLAATAVTVVVWIRAYKRRKYIEETGLNPDGTVYTRHD